MARVCMRPGCDRPAEVRLSYDTVSCQVWLDSIPEVPGPVQEICEFHSLRLTVPRGWILCDRRVASPAMLVPTEVPEPATSQVPLTVGAPTPKVGRRVEVSQPAPIRRRHPNATASQLFADVIDEADPPAGAERIANETPEVDSPEVGSPDLEKPEAESSAGRPTENVEPSDDEPSDSASSDSASSDSASSDSASSDDEAGEATKPTSPLLARAFAQTGPQRSVLSDDLRVPDEERSARRGR